MSENLTLNEVFITCEKPGYSSDLEFLKNLKNLKTIKINKYVAFQENFRLEIPFVGVGNNLKYLLIENAAIRFLDLKQIGKTCQVLETLRIEGAENDKSDFTYLTVHELSHFLSTCICRCTLKELRITNISSIPRDPSHSDPEFAHGCAYPHDCENAQKRLMEEAKLRLVPEMKNQYARDCFIFFMYLNVHFLMTIDDPYSSHDHPNLAGLLVVKDREKDIRVELTQYDLEFDEYFDYKQDHHYNWDYVLRPRDVPPLTVEYSEDVTSCAMLSARAFIEERLLISVLVSSFEAIYGQLSHFAKVAFQRYYLG